MLLLVCVAGCGDNPQTAEASAPGPQGEEIESDVVVVEALRFRPASLTVAVGTHVVWDNEDAIGHRVTAGTPDAPAETFDLVLSDSGARAAITFAEAGTYAYFCRIHSSMVGEIVVE